jgi:hypothetical protein
MSVLSRLEVTGPDGIGTSAGAPALVPVVPVELDLPVADEPVPEVPEPEVPEDVWAKAAPAEKLSASAKIAMVRMAYLCVGLGLCVANAMRHASFRQSQGCVRPIPAAPIVIDGRLGLC